MWLDPRVNLGMGSPRQVGQKIKEPVVQSQGIHTTYIIRLGDKYHEEQVGRTPESSFSGAGRQELGDSLFRIMWDGFSEET